MYTGLPPSGQDSKIPQESTYLHVLIRRPECEIRIGAPVQSSIATDSCGSDGNSAPLGWWPRMRRIATRSRQRGNRRHAGFGQRAKYHTIRHSFTTHLPEAGYDITTVRDLLARHEMSTKML
jgi:hypothetical protein